MSEIQPGYELPHYSRGRNPRVTQIVLHESVDATRDQTVRTLEARRLGVHFIVDRDGSVTAHAPVEYACAHAEGIRDAQGHSVPSAHNEASVAIECVNRYYGSAVDDVRKRYPLYADAKTIRAVWADKGSYILPTPVQVEAIWSLCLRLCAPPLDIPVAFPAPQPGTATGSFAFTWGRWKGHEGARGIMAHHRWDHADGLFVECYCFHRSVGWGPDDAWAKTLAAASSGKRETRVDPYVAPKPVRSAKPVIIENGIIPPKPPGPEPLPKIDVEATVADSVPIPPKAPEPIPPVADVAQTLADIAEKVVDSVNEKLAEAGLPPSPESRDCANPECPALEPNFGLAAEGSDFCSEACMDAFTHPSRAS